MRGVHLIDLVEKLTDPPSGGTPQKWNAGVGLPVVISIYALSCIVFQSATVVQPSSGPRYGRWQYTQLVGAPAMWYGTALLIIALYCHFQWYWGNDKKLVYYFELPRLSTLLLLPIAIILFFVSLFSST